MSENDGVIKASGLSRRKFFGVGIAAGSACATGVGAQWAGCEWLTRAGLRPAPTEADLLEVAAQEVKPFEFDEITVAELQDGMKAGTFTARSIAEKYLERIEAIDKRGPALRRRV